MGQAVGRGLDDTCSAVMVQRQWREVGQREPVNENRHLDTGSRRYHFGPLHQDSYGVRTENQHGERDHDNAGSGNEHNGG